MAEKWLEPILKEAKIFSELKQVVQWIRVDDKLNAVRRWNDLTQDLAEICQNYGKVDVMAANALWDELQVLVNASIDMTFLGDKIEHDILPKVETYMMQYGHIYVEEETIGIESTATGFLTLKDLENNVYFHSTTDPMWEARLLAQHIYDPQKASYAILGSGLGYLAYQLYEISRGTILINLYEQESRIVEYARKYGVLDWIPKENINIIEIQDILPFLEDAERENVGFHINAYAVERLPKDVKPAIEELYIEYNSMRRNANETAINFWKNMRSNSKLISELNREGWGREFVVVAAGPSLDDSLQFLREQKGHRTIIAVGTVFRKLIQNNIAPDLVVVLDPFKTMHKQIQGVEKQKIPMLLSMATYWKLADEYQGEKYLIPISGDKEAVDFAEKNNVEIWACGGTVTSLAIETAVKLGAEKVYMVGVDLAFPGGYTHASGTAERKSVEEKGLIEIEGVRGTVTYTDKLFNLYRKQMEEQIAATPHIVYYNMSNVGARIKGTIEAGDGFGIESEGR